MASVWGEEHRAIQGWPDIGGDQVAAAGAVRRLGEFAAAAEAFACVLAAGTSIVGDWFEATATDAERSAIIEFGKSPAASLAQWTDIALTLQAYRLSLVANRRAFVLTVAFRTPTGLDRSSAARFSQLIKAATEAALEQSFQQAREQARAAALHAALDATATGIAVLEDGRLGFVNSAMQRLLDEGDGLRSQGGALIACDMASAVNLQVAVSQAQLSASDDERSGRAVSLLVRRYRREQPLTVTVIPGPMASAGFPAATVVVYVVDPEIDWSIQIRPLCQLFGLSAVETSLAVHLVAGLTIGVAAQLMRIKEQTARAYLKQVFGKTGATRQADLVRLLLSAAVRLDRRPETVPRHGRYGDIPV